MRVKCLSCDTASFDLCDVFLANVLYSCFQCTIFTSWRHIQLGSLDSLLRQVSVMRFWLRANRSLGSIEAMVSFGIQAMGSVAAIWLQLWMWTDMLTLWSIKMLFCWRSDSCWVGWSSDMQSSMSVLGILFVFRYSCNTGIAVTWWGQLM